MEVIEAVAVESIALKPRWSKSWSSISYAVPRVQSFNSDFKLALTIGRRLSATGKAVRQHRQQTTRKTAPIAPDYFYHFDGYAARGITPDFAENKPPKF